MINLNYSLNFVKHAQNVDLKVRLIFKKFDLLQECLDKIISNFSMKNTIRYPVIRDQWIIIMNINSWNLIFDFNWIKKVIFDVADVLNVQGLLVQI